jgi:hypothetical protein
MLCKQSVRNHGRAKVSITDLSWFSSWERSVLTGLAAGMLLMGGMLLV